jgi:predicted small secreted protein
MSRMRQALIVTVVGVLLATLVSGCGTGRGKVKPILSEAEIAALAGRWEGTGTGPGGRSEPAMIEIRRDAKYRATIGAFVAMGTLQASGGKLVTVPERGLIGASATDHGATIEVREKDGRLVAIGNGRSDRGPYSFEVTKRQ